MSVFSILQHLRFSFGYYFLPVFLFAVSMADSYDLFRIGLLFIALFVFIYPAGFAYASYVERDDIKFGGHTKLDYPGKEVFYLSVLFDLIGLGISLYLSINLMIGLLVYILLSRAYTWKGIRLKKLPVIGFITVLFSQGILMFTLVYISVQNFSFEACVLQTNYFLPSLISSLFVASIFLIAQVYRHKADAKAGEKTLSTKLKIKGTFEFSGVLFLLASLLMAFHFVGTHQSHLFYIFLLFVFPVVAYFFWWFSKVWENKNEANYRHTMMLQKFYATCMSLYFLFVLVVKNVNELPL